jgi:ribosome biogenesis GTPase
VGKSTLLNRLLNQDISRTGGLSKFGTGKQTTTSTRLIPTLDQGFIVDTPGFRNLSVRGISRHWLAEIFPEFPSTVLDDPMSFDPEDEATLIQLDLEFPERLKSLQRLWSEMAEKNPNARGQ